MFLGFEGIAYAPGIPLKAQRFFLRPGRRCHKWSHQCGGCRYQRKDKGAELSVLGVSLGLGHLACQ